MKIEIRRLARHGAEFAEEPWTVLASAEIPTADARRPASAARASAAAENARSRGGIHNDDKLTRRHPGKECGTPWRAKRAYRLKKR
ncbi:hypothetical protein V5799_009032 [Amblyomma americanum]|uniref:Uncharacterized protein n=1 Tax=Amblyomma americanum TaxID=6943 RepID=A0AAQ4FBE3_AMBAM